MPEATFNPSENRLAGVFRVNARLPEPVFVSEFTHFGFLEFEEMTSPRFWCLLKNLAAISGDSTLTVASLVRDATEQGSENLIGSRIASFDAAVGAYRKVLTDASAGAEGRPFDLLHAYVLAWVPKSKRWGIWGERSLSTLVVGLRDAFGLAFAELAGACGLKPWTDTELMGLVELDFGILPGRRAEFDAAQKFRQFKQAFLRNYGLVDAGSNGGEKTD